MIKYWLTHAMPDLLLLDLDCCVHAGAVLGLVGAQLVFNLRHKRRSGPGTLYHEEMRTIARRQYDVGASTGSMLGIVLTQLSLLAQPSAALTDNW